MSRTSLHETLENSIESESKQDSLQDLEVSEICSVSDMPIKLQSHQSPKESDPRIYRELPAFSFESVKEGSKKGSSKKSSKSCSNESLKRMLDELKQSFSSLFDLKVTESEKDLKAKEDVTEMKLLLEQLKLQKIEIDRKEEIIKNLSASHAQPSLPSFSEPFKPFYAQFIMQQQQQQHHQEQIIQQHILNQKYQKLKSKIHHIKEKERYRRKEKKREIRKMLGDLKEKEFERNESIRKLEEMVRQELQILTTK